MTRTSTPIILALWCALVAMPLCAATPPATATITNAAAAQAPARHFIWRISKGHDELYLVGSIHALNSDDYPLPAVMENAFRHSAALVEEINLTLADPASMQREALRLGAYPHGKSLRTALPPAVYQKVAAGAAQLGIDMQRLDRLRPWLGSIAILDMQLQQANFNSAEGVDHHFADQAQMTGKRVIGLETPRYQFELLARLPEKAQQEMLLESLDEARSFKGEMLALISAWRKGDAAGVAKLMRENFVQYPLAYRMLIVDRNRAWFPRLERLLHSGRRYFVVVGALHLVGPDGLLARFEKAGYEVEQL